MYTAYDTAVLGIYCTSLLLRGALVCALLRRYTGRSALISTVVAVFVLCTVPALISWIDKSALECFGFSSGFKYHLCMFAWPFSFLGYSTLAYLLSSIPDLQTPRSIAHLEIYGRLEHKHIWSVERLHRGHF